MKAQQTFSITFWVNQAKRKAHGLCPIWCRVTINGNRAQFSINQNILPENWSKRKQKVKGEGQEIEQINKYIKKVQGDLESIYANMKLEGDIISAVNIKCEYLNKDTLKNKEGFVQIAESCLSYLQDAVKHQSYAWGTVKNYKTTVKYLKEFIKKEYRVEDIHIKKVKASLIYDFKKFVTSMTTIKKRDKNGIVKSFEKTQKCNQNGFVKHMQRLKRIMKWAIKNEWTDRNPFALIDDEHLIEKDALYLTKAELLSLESLELPKEGLGISRDMFVFCCYTGLSFCDVLKLSVNQITLKLDARKWIFTQRQKSGVDSLIPVLHKINELLSFYGNLASETASETIFPSITNQVYNRNLKKIFKLCSISKNFTSHSARHTFGTTICADNSVPMDTTAKMMGHLDFRSTKKYYRTTPNRMSSDISALEEKLNKTDNDNMNQMRKSL
jgi:site-specific recombinase XerD